MDLESIIQVVIVIPLGDPSQPDCRWGMPLLIWGDPGIGKSQRIRRLSFNLGLYAGIVLPSGKLPEDFAGVPVQDGKGGLHLVCTMGEIKKLCQIGEGLLFIDEINTARAAVQAAVMGVVQDLRSGEIDIPLKVRIIAAANPVEVSAGGHAIEVPLASRFAHIHLPPSTAAEWSDYMMGLGQTAEATPIVDAEQRVTKMWPDVWATARGEFCGFVQAVPDTLHNIPKPGDPNRSRAFPTERMMEWAARASATCKALNVGNALEMEIVKACIGDGAGLAFAKYRKDANLPSPKKVLADGFEPDKRRLDRSYAVYCSLAAYVATIPHKPQQVAAALKAWPILEQGCKAGLSDIIYKAAAELVNKGLSSLGGAELAKASEPVVSRFGEKLRMRAKNVYTYESTL